MRLVFVQLSQHLIHHQLQTGDLCDKLALQIQAEDQETDDWELGTVQCISVMPATLSFLSYFSSISFIMRNKVNL